MKTALRLMLALWFLPVSVSAQETGIFILLKGGYTAFGMDGLTKFMDAGVEYYTNRGVPMELQKSFPGNFLVGGEVMYDMDFILNGGIGAYSTRTLGYAGYRDNFGTVKLTSRVNTVVIHAVLRLRFAPTPGGEGYLALKPGVFFAQWNFSERIEYDDIPQLNQIASFRADAKGVFGEIILGVRNRDLVPLLQFTVEIGMRFGASPEFHSGGRTTMIEISAIGPVAVVGVGVLL